MKRRIDLARACMHAIAPALHARTFHTPLDSDYMYSFSEYMYGPGPSRPHARLCVRRFVGVRRRGPSPPRPHVHVCASGGLSACAGSLPRGLVFGPTHPTRLVCVLCCVPSPFPGLGICCAHASSASPFPLPYHILVLYVAFLPVNAGGVPG